MPVLPLRTGARTPPLRLPAAMATGTGTDMRRTTQVRAKTIRLLI